MSRYRLFVVLTIASVGIIGCATRKDYVDPISESTAKLTFVAGEGTIAATVEQQADSNCNLLNGIASISENPDKGFVITRYPRVKEKTISIPADAPFRFQVGDNRNGAFGTYYCNVASEFRPTGGSEYKVIWSFQAFSCGIEFLEKMSSGAWQHSRELRSIEPCQN